MCGRWRGWPDRGERRAGHREGVRDADESEAEIAEPATADRMGETPMADTSSAGRRHAERARRREKPQQIADELRRLIIAGELDEGDSLGHEPDLIERFGVSRPSLREALRILEAEGLITVVARRARRRRRAPARPAADGAHRRARAAGPQRLARRRLRRPHDHRARRRAPRRLGPRPPRGRTAAPASSSPSRSRPSTTPRRSARRTPASTRSSSPWPATRPSRSSPRCSTRSWPGPSPPSASPMPTADSTATRRRGVRSQERLAALIEAGDADAAEEHWRTHMTVVGRVMLGQQRQDGHRPPRPLLAVR